VNFVVTVRRQTQSNFLTKTKVTDLSYSDTRQTELLLLKLSNIVRTVKHVYNLFIIET